AAWEDLNKKIKGVIVEAKVLGKEKVVGRKQDWGVREWADENGMDEDAQEAEEGVDGDKSLKKASTKAHDERTNGDEVDDELL
ncbi:MAG: hypothetical protein Q9201_003281, partial [Fulgogasparrea decipioides]